MEAFWRSRTFKFVVILDHDGRFLACMLAWATKNLEALVVTDKDNRLKGIAEREQILTKMVLDMTR